MKSAESKLRDTMVEAEARWERHRQDDATWEVWQQAATAYYAATHPAEAHRRHTPSDGVPTVEEIRERARWLDEAHHAVPHDGHVSRDPAYRTDWSAKAGWAHEMSHGLYTDALWTALAEATSGQADGLEYLVRFLEADPWCHRSGYVKQQVITAITRLDLAPPSASRLRKTLLAVVDDPRHRREYRAYCRLARRLATPELRAELEARLTHPSAAIRRHATWVLAAMP